jgi:hypothetical protein
MLDHDDTREPACAVLDCEPDHVNYLACPRVWPLHRLINRHLNYSFRAVDVHCVDISRQLRAERKSTWLNRRFMQ